MGGRGEIRVPKSEGGPGKKTHTHTRALECFRESTTNGKEKK